MMIAENVASYQGIKKNISGNLRKNIAAKQMYRSIM